MYILLYLRTNSVSLCAFFYDCFLICMYWFPIAILTTSFCSSESWVDLSNQPGSPDRVTPLPFGNGEEYLRLLREAQRESNQSSARVSLASSRRDTPRDSPHDSWVLGEWRERGGKGGKECRVWLSCGVRQGMFIRYFLFSLPYFLLFLCFLFDACTGTLWMWIIISGDSLHHR